MSRKLNGRKAFTVAAVAAVAGTALLNVGAANAATPGATGKVNLAAVESSLTGVTLTLTGTNFLNSNNTSNLANAGLTGAKVGGIVTSTATCAAVPSAVDSTHGLLTSVGANSASKATLTISAPTAAGAFKVCVKTTAGTFISAPLTVAAAYAVATTNGVYPASGPAAGGQSVVITGDTTQGAFRKESVVTIGGQPAAKIAVAADGTSIVAVTAPGVAAAGAAVTVAAPGFTTKSSTQNYTRVNTLKVSPSVALPGDTVTLTGTGFTSATIALMAQGGDTAKALPCRTQQVVSSTEIACTLLNTSVAQGGATDGSANFNTSVANGTSWTFITGTHTVGTVTAGSQAVSTTVAATSQVSDASTLTVADF